MLDQARLTIHKGDFAVISGISGIGKSTLLKLLLSVYQATEGAINLRTAGGTSILAGKATRKLFAYVPQGNLLLSGTVREAVTFIRQLATDEEIMEAARISCAEEFIRELPHGLNTVLGEKGYGLSEGQIQRLAITRAILSAAPVLLFDEATSALDEATEAKLLKNIKSMENKTCIIISHKRAAFSLCNKEIRLEDKKLITKGGNHDVYYKRPVMNIELHRALISEKYEKFYDYSGSGWQLARLKESCQYIYEMSKEDFYIYHMAHLVKHYQNGGTGIRSVMDVWVYLNRYRTEMDWNYINSELNKMELLAFTKNIEKLSACWFDGVESCELFDKMTAFILSNGVHGLSKNSFMIAMMKNNAAKSFKIVKVLYTLNLFFPDRKTMVILFPVLNKLPFLLPVTWVLRGLRCVFFKPQNIVKNLSCVASVNKQDAQNLQRLHQNAGL